jgi:N6-adenosine-specific RNA methylase IME4
MKYGAILADPPWSFRRYDGKDVIPQRAAAQHYDTMSMEAIADLPVQDFAADDCALFLWITWPTMPDALAVVRSWGFTYKTCAFTWLKGKSMPLFDVDEFPDLFNSKMGTGYWTRSNSEVCLLATRGRPQRKSKSVRQVIQAPLREHSRKPDEIYAKIEALVDGPYMELFARQEWPNWHRWGNETNKFN